MENKRIIQIKKQIEQIKKALQKIGEMRPGSLNLQYKDPKRKMGAYYQLNYTYKMKSETKYVRKDAVPQIEKEILNYKNFKQLIDEWIALSIELSQLKMKLG